ncbi:uncharacterized protein L969DRAFT_95184 [Mixia osmundae IAM 14324]|uniref:Smr domain-containing protein n=1 Tax=Mixia osmundae (strain CBS 9802 / IAM 14324 / JCM 22182 / KY 12970) TaxID=764103 RepID=G7E6X4_MIXOS|nr:uncharacterized protein L969DRAFT_95184 [Mixia osmundae IAM 14324]KEI39033.1 hypothetical protein L969DRAFT_95184 [Mixia osmundae IAM 14324]GAA98584.1 hypothetical protein E5Q_05271 [Mixia osmundae IAM 14324]
MSTLFDKLQQDYCPDLSPVIVLAILNELEPQDETVARDQLNMLLHHAQLNTSVEPAPSPSPPLSTDDSASNASEPLSLSSNDEAFAFLETCFPDIPLSQLSVALESAQNDADRAVEILLSEQLIETGLQDDAASASTSADEALATGLSHRSNGRKKKHKPAQTQTISLTDVRKTQARRGAGSDLSDDDSSTHPRSTRKNGVGGVSRWILLESQAKSLAMLLHIEPQQITSAYHKADSSLPLALDKIMDELEAKRPCADLPDSVETLAHLKIMFPDRSFGALQRLLSATDGVASDAIDLMWQLDEITRRDGTPLFSALVSSSAHTPTNYRASIVHSNSASIPKEPTPTPVPTLASLPQRVRPAVSREPDAAQCTAMADRYRDKRNDAYRSATRLWQSGGKERTAAGTYSERGREFEAMAKEWDLRAARALVDTRTRKYSKENTIDLHHLTVAQANVLVMESLNTWQASVTRSQPMHIITGAGLHSTGQHAVLLPSISKLLKKEGYSYKLDGGARGGRSSGLIVWP